MLVHGSIILCQLADKPRRFAKVLVDVLLVLRVFFFQGRQGFLKLRFSAIARLSAMLTRVPPGQKGNGSEEQTGDDECY